MKYSQERYFTPVEYMDCSVSVSCGIMKEKDFLQAESLGVEAPRRYKKCGGCSECSFRGDRCNRRKLLSINSLNRG